MTNFDEKFEKLKNLIEENNIYFDSDDFEKTACQFFENYANDRKLPYSCTPPSWLADEIHSIMED